MTTTDYSFQLTPSTQTITVTKTRPANTTAYTAEDVVSENASSGTAWTFANAARTTGGSGTIVRAVLLDDDTARTQSMILFLYNVTPTCNLNDNVANDGPVSADADNFIGAIEFDALVDQGTGFSYATQVPGNGNLPLPFQCASGDNDIYGVLVDDTGFTPSSGEIFRITLQVVQD